ncbi:MAG: alpha/beta fold hydrolase [Lentisphaerae bacterium]|nr:alpha/beta fold hydrolase [Lentisphaerota bacterium]
MAEDFLEKVFPFKRNWFERESIRIHYVDEGQGNPLVMFHACPMWSFAYRNLIRDLSADHRVIAFDLPGFGLSTAEKNFDFTLNGYINITETFLEALEIEKATLVLHGWGGTVGMGYAVRHPRNIRSLVILNTLSFTPGSLPLRLHICRIPWLGAKLVVNLNLLLLGNRHHCKEIADAYDYPYRSCHSRYPLYRFVEDFPSVPESDSAQLIMEIEAGLWMFRSTPAVIVWAMRDWLYTARQLKWWQRYLPGAEVHRLERAGRYIQEDAPDELIRFIRDFLVKNKI